MSARYPTIVAGAICRNIYIRPIYFECPLLAAKVKPKRRHYIAFSVGGIYHAMVRTDGQQGHVCICPAPARSRRCWQRMFCNNTTNIHVRPAQNL